jgi:cell division protein FtsQ
MAEDRVTLKLFIDRISNKTKFLIRVLLVIAVLIFLIALLFICANSVYRSFQPVTIRADEIPNLESNEIFIRANCLNLNYWSFHVKEVRAKLLDIAAIEDAAVEKHFPNKVSIKLKAREPLAVVAAYTDNRPQFMFTSKSGKVFEKGKSIREFYHPLITDPNMQNVHAGSQFSEPVVSLLLNKLSLLSETSRSCISEIVICRKISGTLQVDVYDILIYFRESRVQIRINPEDLDNRFFGLMASAVKEAELGRLGSVKEIDYRSNNPVFITDSVFMQRGGSY